MPLPASCTLRETAKWFGVGSLKFLILLLCLEIYSVICYWLLLAVVVVVVGCC